MQIKQDVREAEDTFCEWALSVHWEGVSAGVRRQALTLLADSLACMTAGVQHETTRACLRISPPLALGSNQLVGIEGRLNATEAARIMGVAAHVLEMDDLVPSASLHPGTVIIPAALAAGQYAGAGGDRILAAIIAGYELMTRLGEAIDPARQYAYGFHPTATCGVFGAACAAGLLLGADPPSLRRALGLAGTGASGTLSYLNDGAPTKPIQVGNAVAYGVMAALLNAGGVPGPSTVFGGRYGFYQTYARGGDADRLVAGLGSDPLGLAQTGIKSLACCGYIQPDVALALELARRERVAPSDIQAIRAGVVSTAVPIVGEPRALKMRPQTVVDVQFSLPYCMAAALTYGQLMPADVVRSLSDEQLTGLAGRVTLTADPALDDRYPAHWGGWVELALRDGRRLFAETIDCKGHPGNLLSDEQLRAKLASLTSPAMASAILEVAADFPDQTAAELFGRLGRKALAPA